MFKTKLRTVGNSVVTTMPKIVMELAGVEEGDEIKWSVKGRKIYVEKMKKNPTEKRGKCSTS